MNTELTPPSPDQGRAPEATAAPSAEFINAVSEFFDTDPSDLLVELGYYQREDDSAW